MSNHPPPPRSIRQRSDRPSVAAVLSGTVATLFILVRLAVVGHGQVARFIMAEHPFANPSLLPPGIPVLPKNGYDGQFFYRLALDAADLHRQAFGITLDNTFRLQRIGYPVLAWLLSFGQHSWAPTTLVLVNLAAIAGLASVGARFAQDGGGHALWGLFIAGYFGFVIVLSRDTAEAVATLCPWPDSSLTGAAGPCGPRGSWPTGSSPARPPWSPSPPSPPSA